MQTDVNAIDGSVKLEPTCEEHSGLVKVEASSAFITSSSSTTPSSAFSTTSLLADGAGTSTLPLPLPDLCCSWLEGNSESQAIDCVTDLVVPLSCMSQSLDLPQVDVPMTALGCGSQDCEVPVIESKASASQEPKASVSQESKASVSQEVGGLLAIKGDGLCCYYCANAIGVLCKNEDALVSDWAPCSMVEVEAARLQIMENLNSWYLQKRPFYLSDEEFEADDFPHLQETRQKFTDRLMGKINKGEEMWGSSCDLALYSLFTDVLVVVISPEKLSKHSSLEQDEKLACRELWYDCVVEAPKTRVVCIILQNHHFQFGVVRSPRVRAIFRRGADWDAARHLIAKRAPWSPVEASASTLG